MLEQNILSRKIYLYLSCWCNFYVLNSAEFNIYINDNKDCEYSTAHFYSSQ